MTSHLHSIPCRFQQIYEYSPLIKCTKTHTTMLLNHMRFRHPRCSSAAASIGRPFCHSAPACFRSAQTCRATSRSSEGSSQQDDGRWWDGPAPGGGSSVPEGPVPKMPEELSHAETEVLRQGPEEAARWENIRKNERQRSE